MTTAETRRRVLENRLRRVAWRRGLSIAKDGPDRYMVLDARTGVAVLGIGRDRRVFTASMADVKAFLEMEEQTTRKAK